MNQALRNLAYRLTKKRVNERKLNVTEINIKSSELSYFNLSSNSIVSFKINDEIYYFRECPLICRRKEFFKKAIDRFFDTINNLGISREHFSQELPINVNFSADVVESFREYIENSIKTTSLLMVVSQVDVLSEQYNFSIWTKQTYTKKFFNSFGLSGLNDNLYDIGIYFLWFMRSYAYTYRTLRFVRGRQYSFFSAVKSVATSVIAEELDLPEIVTKATWCRLITDNGELFGVISNSAPGSRMCDTDLKPCPSLQRELLTLNLFDIICYQTDHGPNNYNVFQTPDGEYRVCAFDNDNPNTFFPISKIHGSFAGCSQFVSVEGVVLRPYFPKETAEKLMNLDLKKLVKALKPYLNSFQLNALKKRIIKLRKAISKTASENKNFLLGSDGFNMETVQNELNLPHGETYLSKIL